MFLRNVGWLSTDNTALYNRSLLPAFTLVSCSAYFSTLKMEAVCSSETSVDFQRTTWRYIPEYCTLQEHWTIYLTLVEYLLKIQRKFSKIQPLVTVSRVTLPLISLSHVIALERCFKITSSLHMDAVNTALWGDILMQYTTIITVWTYLPWQRRTLTTLQYRLPFIATHSGPPYSDQATGCTTEDLRFDSR
jgi:hypothetical protein